MISQKRILTYSAIAVDQILLFLCFTTAAILAQPLYSIFEIPGMLLLLVLQFPVWYFSTQSNGLYQNFGTRLYIEQIIAITQAIGIQIVATILFIFAIKQNMYARYFIVYYTLLLAASIGFRTVLFNKLLKYKQSLTKPTRKLLIIGSGELALDFFESIQQNPSFGYTEISLIGNTPCDEKNYIGSIDKLEQVLSAGKFDEALIATEKDSTIDLVYIVNRCHKYNVHTYFIPEYVRFLSNRFDFFVIGDHPILSIRREPLDELHWRFFKRTVDILIASLTLLFIGSWLFPIIAILQKILSEGPVFYLQERIGKDNTTFMCYKFRSMKNSYRGDSFQPVVDKDNRITAFGSFLRKSNIDELPQIFNVLKGEMSIVGPRPHAVIYNKFYEEFVEELRLRNLVKPGITGWAQINGLRGDVPDLEENRKRFKKKIEFDIWYIENWSPLIDFQIIFITFWQMVRGNSRGL